MSEANAPVRLLYRHVPLAESPTVETVADGVFVALDAPPPVRTVLRLEREDGTVTGLRVTRVVEVEGADPRGTRGFYARTVDGDALADGDQVGSEHLRTPESAPEAFGASAQTTGEDDSSDTGHVAMAMPAPVVVDEDDDDDDAHGGEAGSESAESSDDAEAASSAEADPEADPDADDSGSRRGRGRKRRAKKPKK